MFHKLLCAIVFRPVKQSWLWIIKLLCYKVIIIRKKGTQLIGVPSQYALLALTVAS